MFTRTKNKWNVTIQREDGQMTTKDYETYWSPDKIDPMLPAIACAAELTLEHPNRMKHAGLTATLIEPVAA